MLAGWLAIVAGVSFGWRSWLATIFGGFSGILLWLATEENWRRRRRRLMRPRLVVMASAGVSQWLETSASWLASSISIKCGVAYSMASICGIIARRGAVVSENQAENNQKCRVSEM